MRFVGDPVACVVAETALQAKDAAEAVELDIEPLPAVTLASEAAKPGAPQLYDDVPGNVQLDFLLGEPEKVAEAFAKAAHVTRLSPEEHPRGGGGDGAALGAVQVRGRALHAHRQSQGVFAHAATSSPTSSACRRTRCAGDAERRRLVRHEGARSIPSTCASRTRRARSGAR